MNLNYLKYFVVVAELKSFTEASEKLFITQPTLSVSIQKLEKKLGVKLLNRTKKGQKASISLTISGKYFLEKAKYILAQFESIKTELHHDYGNTKKLKLGTLPCISTNLAHKFIISLHNAFPDIVIEQITGNSLELESWLSKGDINVTLNIFSDEDKEIDKDSKTSKILHNRNYFIGISKTHKLAQKASFSIEELNGTPYIDIAKCEVRPYLQKIFKERNISPKIIGKTQHGFLADSLVASGAGLAVIPERTEIPGVTTLPFSDFSLRRLIGLKWQANENPEIIDFFHQFSCDWREKKSGGDKDRDKFSLSRSLP